MKNFLLSLLVSVALLVVPVEAQTLRPTQIRGVTSDTNLGTGGLVLGTAPTITTPVINSAAHVGGTWVADATWTLPAVTLGGAVSSTGNPSLNIGSGALTAGAISGTTGAFSNTVTITNNTNTQLVLKDSNTFGTNATPVVRFYDGTGGTTQGAVGFLSDTSGALSIYNNVAAGTDAGSILIKPSGSTVVTVASTGVSVTGTLGVTGAVTFSATSSPASGAACTAGTQTWDASYFYICTASAAWKRVALTGGY